MLGAQDCAQGSVGQWRGFVWNDGGAWAIFAGKHLVKENSVIGATAPHPPVCSSRRINSPPDIFKIAAYGNGKSGLTRFSDRLKRDLVVSEVAANIRDPFDLV